MSIEPLAKSLLAGAKQTRQSEIRRAEKLGEKNALLGLGVKFLDSIGTNILQNRAQQDYVNNFEKNVQGLDLKRVKNVKDHFGTIMKDKQNSKLGWNDFTKSWLTNLYRAETYKNIKPELRVEGRAWESYIDQYVEPNVEGFAKLFEEMEDNYNIADASPEVKQRAYALYKRTQPTTVGSYITNKVAGMFDGKTDDEVKADALAAIRNSKTVQGNRSLLEQWSKIEKQKNALGIASTLKDLTEKAKTLDKTDKIIKEEIKSQIVDDKLIVWTVQKETDPFGNVTTTEVGTRKTWDSLSTSERAREITKELMTTYDLSDRLAKDFTPEGQRIITANLLEKGISPLDIRTPENYRIVADEMGNITMNMPQTLINKDAAARQAQATIMSSMLGALLDNPQDLLSTEEIDLEGQPYNQALFKAITQLVKRVQNLNTTGDQAALIFNEDGTMTAPTNEGGGKE